jgi:DNA-directed RNA polymerase specialized sigma24 family protein
MKAKDKPLEGPHGINVLGLRFYETRLEKDFNRLYKCIEDYLPAIIKTRSFDYPNEILPEVMTKIGLYIWQHIHQFNPEYKFNTWLRTMAYHAFLQILKKYKRSSLQADVPGMQFSYEGEHFPEEEYTDFLGMEMKYDRHDEACKIWEEFETKYPEYHKILSECLIEGEKSYTVEGEYRRLRKDKKGVVREYWYEYRVPINGYPMAIKRLREIIKKYEFN